MGSVPFLLLYRLRSDAHPAPSPTPIYHTMCPDMGSISPAVDLPGGDYYHCQVLFQLVAVRGVSPLVQPIAPIGSLPVSVRFSLL
jgi:hypothetical protein